MTILHQKPLLGQQINWSHPLSKGLVGCWIMNEGSGGRVYGLSGNGNIGTINDITHMYWAGGSLYTDGDVSDGYIECGTSGLFDPRNENFTVFVRYKALSTVSARCIIGKSLVGSLDHWWLLHLDADGKFVVEFDDTVAKRTITSAIAYDDSSWHSFCAVRRASVEIEAYVDGISVGTAATVGDVDTSAYEFHIGKPGRTVIENAAYGYYDLVFVFKGGNAALTSSQIQSLHIDPYGLIADPYQIETLLDVVIVGETCWGHVTSVIEANVRTFFSNWTGTGTIGNSGDTERLELNSGEYMISEVVDTGIETVILKQNYYDPTGDDVDMDYRHGASSAACEVASWNNYTAPFTSLGYVQVRMTSTL